MSLLGAPRVPKKTPFPTGWVLQKILIPAHHQQYDNLKPTGDWFKALFEAGQPFASHPITLGAQVCVCVTVVPLSGRRGAVTSTHTHTLISPQMSLLESDLKTLPEHCGSILTGFQWKNLWGPIFGPHESSGPHELRVLTSFGPQE